jgi:Zn-dependent peptidase ImmA (M78 family)
VGITRKLKVSPHTYSVEEIAGLADDGTCQAAFEKIFLGAEQARGQKADTLLHETLHAVFNQGLDEQLKELDKGLEETLCSFLAPRILGVIRDNPWFVDYLREA